MIVKKLVAVAVLFWCSVSFGQMLEERDGVIELSLGFPNMRPLTSDPAGVLHGGFDFNDPNGRSYGQFIVKGEFFLTDKMGISASMNYGYFSSYDESVFQQYNGITGQYETHTYFYKARIHKTRLAAGFNFHALRTSRVDSYFGFQAGIKKSRSNYQTNDPNIDPADFSTYVFPLAFRVQYGLRIFFNEYLAANMELGLGGPLVSFGATYKF